jgi:pimeloyl-ACP methyl ester carboxylesterase
MVRKVLVWTGSLYAASLVLAFIGGGLVLAHPARLPVDDDILRQAIPAHWDMDFLRETKNVSIRIGERTHLSATVIGGGSYATVVVLHESGSNRLAGLPAAYALWNAGFDVVLLDRRAQGESDGDMRPLFGAEHKDVKAVVDRLVDEQWTGVERIGLFGIGDGGTTALIAAAVDSRVDAVAALDPALKATDFVENALCSRLLLPAPLLSAQTYFAVKGMSLVSGVPGDELDATRSLGRLDATALLLISPRRSGEADALEVFKAIPPGQAELARVGSNAAPEDFTTLVDFFKRGL